MEKKGVHMTYIQIIQYMYDGVTTSVKTPRSETNNFSIRIGLYQGLALGSNLFKVVLDVLTRDTQKIIPKCIFFMDDIILIEELRKEVNSTLGL